MATPEELAQLLQYGRDTSQLGMRNTQAPGHWTQALAGALQMGIGGHYGAKGAYGMGQGKMAANKRLGELLAGGDPKVAAQGMLQDAWLGDEGRKMALQELDPMRKLQMQKAQLSIENARSDMALNPLRREKLQMDLQAARTAQERARAMDDMIMGAAQPQPAVAPVDVPTSGAARFAAPSIAPEQPQNLGDLVRAMPSNERAMFLSLWQAGDKKGALEMLQKRNAPAEYSKTVIPGTDAQGNTVLIQPSATGEATTAKLPEGVKVDFGARKGAELNAKEMAKLQFGMPKSKAALRTLEQQHAIVDRSIDRATPLINELTTGFSGYLLKDLPSTTAYNLQRLLDTVKANIGFDALNSMRQNSPTGGALGNVTERELAFLQAVAGSLDQAQTVDQVLDVLGQVKENFRVSREIRRRAFQEEYAPLFGGQMAPLPDGIKMNFAPAGGQGDGFKVEYE